MISFPPAKINLGLQVLRKRADGYHDLSTCMVEIPLTDVLEIVPSERFSFSSTGLDIPAGENLCEKAWRLLHTAYGIPAVQIHLHKIIPMGAGLGGGSSDAAYTLTMLNKLFNIGLTDEKLMELAAELGSDCAFFVKGGVQLAQGRGEVLTQMELQLPAWIAVINPGIHISTAEAYASVTPDENVPELSTLLSHPYSEWKNLLINDFEHGATAKHPNISGLINRLYTKGAVYAAMSGSGSTVFGLFTEKSDPENFSGMPFVSILRLANNDAVDL